jgi:hypothetical protein
MADIAASDVTYTLKEGTQFACPSDPRYSAAFAISFGNGALTYPAGGIPLTKGKLGCPTDLEALLIDDASSADGYLYKHDRANNKLRIYQGDNDNAGDAPLVELGNVAVAATTLVATVKGW